MNIIANNCVGGRLYQVRNTKFQNPFVWTRIVHDQFIYLIKNYDNIDWTHPSFGLNNIKSPNYMNAYCKVNDKLSLHYTHYVYDENEHEPTKIGLDVKYDKIIDYTKEKYWKRLEKMKKAGRPIYIYSFNAFADTNERYFSRIKDLFDLKPDIYVIAFKSKQITFELPKHIKPIYLTDEEMKASTGSIAHKINEFVPYE